MKTKFWSMLTIIMVGMMCMCLSSCSKDDNANDNSDKDLIGYWYPESIKNLAGFGIWHFVGNGEAKTDYYVTTEVVNNNKRSDYISVGTYQGMSIYKHKDNQEYSSTYIRNGNEVIVNLGGSDIVYIRLTGTDRFVASERGSFVRIKK